MTEGETIGRGGGESGGKREGGLARRAAEGGEASHGSFSADRCATSVISRE